MDEISIKILNFIGIFFDSSSNINEVIITRDELLSDQKYEEVKKYISDLKKIFKTSDFTCVQKNAEKDQRWPLINLVRQILHKYGYKMEPIRKADGYSLDGTKKYKRFFSIIKK
jgi:hypothetical protein